jgi:phosphoglucosamine mutase
MTPYTITFGTSGIRCHENKPPLITPYICALGTALSKMIFHHGYPPRVVIGWDTRHSSETIAANLARTLGERITLETIGCAPTPTVALLAQNKADYAGGVIITASHNKSPDNGIKLVGQWASCITDAQSIKQLQKDFDSALLHDCLTHTNDFCDTSNHTSSINHYVDQLRNQFTPNFLHNKRIVIDPANGAASNCVTPIFKSYGAQVYVINNKPNGLNINDQSGATSLSSLKAAVQSCNAHFGIAFDGDADRVVLVNAQGIVKDGDDILALLASHPLVKQEQSLVGTILSSRALEQHLSKEHGITLLRSDVGEEALFKLQHQKSVTFGAEPSGHVVSTNWMPTSDGIYAALQVLDLACNQNNISLETFKRVKPASLAMPVTKKDPLTQDPYLSIIQQHDSEFGSMRTIVRYSGTENVLRIFVEADEHDAASDAAQQLYTKLHRAMQ